MTVDLTRPTLLGYVTIKHPAATADTAHELRQHLADFAQAEGFNLAEQFVETLETGTARISALHDKVISSDPVPTVAVLAGTELPKHYAKLLDDAGVPVVPVPLLVRVDGRCAR
ncbi:hypothetical protein GCM10029976_066640 [Kribbella albertanoniae]|uniref:Uncharacterized protein n=1 Tax=Kribbella albertanoniae TaxID=1266829 RepID=A0A4R4QJF8_9ACTN|nr:hypothetical protein [Kribbella albertanoniae]TDC35780.1 hypothetical protein E1261_00175 [Kribbella albertanoniae]